jgi:hypothetical protein
MNWMLLLAIIFVGCFVGWYKPTLWEKIKAVEEEHK